MTAWLYSPDGTLTIAGVALILIVAGGIIAVACHRPATTGRHRDGGHIRRGRRCIATPAYDGWKLSPAANARLAGHMTLAGSSAAPRSPASEGTDLVVAVPARPVSAGDGDGPGTPAATVDFGELYRRYQDAIGPALAAATPWPPFRLAPMLDRALVGRDEEQVAR